MRETLIDQLLWSRLARFLVAAIVVIGFFRFHQWGIHLLLWFIMTFYSGLSSLSPQNKQELIEKGDTKTLERIREMPKHKMSVTVPIVIISMVGATISWTFHSFLTGNS